MELIIFGIYVFLGDYSNRWLQRNLFNIKSEMIFSMQQYILNRIIWGALLGWITIPVVIGYKLIKIFWNRRNMRVESTNREEVSDRAPMEMETEPAQQVKETVQTRRHFCARCGLELRDVDKFCPSCGKSIDR